MTARLTKQPGIFYIGGMFTAHTTVLTLSLASFLLTGALLRLLRSARK
jgi:hypothetical protein